MNAPFGTRFGHARCVACGTENPRSLHLVFHPDAEGGVRGRFAADRDFVGYDGILHGGVAATLLDAAMTHCLFHAGVGAVTADLHVRYVRPVPVGIVVELTARVLTARPPLYRVRAELHANDRLAVWAEGKFLRKPG